MNAIPCQQRVNVRARMASRMHAARPLHLDNNTQSLRVQALREDLVAEITGVKMNATADIAELKKIVYADVSQPQ